MKFSLAALVFAVAVQAQSLKDIPACAIPCLEDSIKKTTSCDSKDLPCVCKPENFDKIRGDTAPCVIGKCGAQVGELAQLPREVRDDELLTDCPLGEVLDKTTKLCQSVGGK